MSDDTRTTRQNVNSYFYTADTRAMVRNDRASLTPKPQAPSPRTTKSGNTSTSGSGRGTVKSPGRSGGGSVKAKGSSGGSKGKK